MARRKAFYSLVSEITAYMRSQLELRDLEEHSSSVGDPNLPPYSTTTTDADGVASPSPSGEGNRGDGSAERPRAYSPGLVRLRRAALRHFDAWRTETHRRLKEVVAKADDAKIVEARRKRTEELRAKAAAEPRRGEDLLVFDDNTDTDAAAAATSASGGSEGQRGHGHGQQSEREKVTVTDGEEKNELEAFQSLYHPIPTRLTTIPRRDREEVLSATMLLLLSAGNYSAYARTLLCYLASALSIPPSRLDAEETAIATTLAQTAAQKADAGSGGMSADAEAAQRREEGRAGRLWKVGLASVAGAAIVGVTGGLAAPVVAAAVGGLMGSVGLGGLAGFLGIFWMNGALVGALFGAFGAKMTGEMVDRYAREVEDFKFLPLGSGAAAATAAAQFGNSGEAGEEAAATRRLRVTIGINGWLETENDVMQPWRVLGNETEVFALRYEMRSLLDLGTQLRQLVSSAAWGVARNELLKRTVLATVQSALWPPVLLLSSASALDNPFSLARNRSDKAGRVLADALVHRVQGERAVTLVGYSLGARVVYSCLRTLAERGAFGVVDTVVLIGAPVPSSAEHWGMMRAVVAGKLFNVHSENDYILGFLYRGTSLQLGIAGLQAVGEHIEGVEDLDLSEEVHGHLRYPALIPQILHRCGFVGVRGGDAVIEKDVEGGSEISMSDRDYPQLGNLIDVGDGSDEGTQPTLPPRLTMSELNFERSSTVENVAGQKGDIPMLESRPLESVAITSNPEKTGKSSSSLSTTDLSEPPRGDSIGIEQRSASAPIPSLEEHRFNDKNEDEYGEGSITMIDDDDLSDGELTMIEPLSIDDDAPTGTQTHP
ncbi:hypothetical protein FHL15_002575 [Xylaria flabelliformis]|uniref:DUF726 domain-containing protein n=1 Tax=Xylaria flabelliformis TaxID=2512241 RepID=A0A553I7Y3_9PEZI|nr:hypothetical protein FHL15_002575 [Xylaria flabelliformis]